MIPRLYAILDIDLCRARGVEPLVLTDRWLACGVRLFQLRAKTMASGAMLTLASTLSARARAAEAIFIVNDRVDIAVLAGAHGVHVGQGDLAPASARRLMPAPSLVGVSTHTEAQVEMARQAPVNYLAIGPVFQTTSKVQPDPVVGLEGVRRAVERAGGLPVVAIGGITLERAADVLHAGATSVAVISDLLVGDPGERAEQFLRVVVQ